MFSDLTLRFPVPCRPISENESRQLHWSVRRSHLEPWKMAAWVTAKQAKVAPMPKTAVAVTLPFPTNRRRDPHNYVGTVVKAIIDGLVYAHVWPDDNPDWVTVLEPIIRCGKDLQPIVSVYLQPVREEAIR